MNYNGIASYEACFGALSGHITPSKRAPQSPSRGLESGASQSGKRRTFNSASSSSDRFIPQRSAMDLDVSHFELTVPQHDRGEENRLNASPAKEEYKKELAQTLMQTPASNKVLAFKTRPKLPDMMGEQSSLRVRCCQEAHTLPEHCLSCDHGIQCRQCPH